MTDSEQATLSKADSSRFTAGTKKWFKPRSPRFWILLTGLLYTLCGFFLVPHLLQSAIIGLVQDDLGRSARIERIQFNPFLLSLRVLGLTIEDTDGAKLIAFDALYVDFQLSSLLRRAWTFDEVELDKPYLLYERLNATESRLSRLLADLPASDNKETDAENDEAAVPRVLIHRLAISRGALVFIDRVPATQVELDLGPVEITIDELNTLPERLGKQLVSIDLPEGAQLQWSGDLSLNPLYSEGELTLKALRLDALTAYLREYIAISQFDATVSSQLQYRLGIRDNQPTLDLDEIGITVSDLAIASSASEREFLTTSRISLAGGTLRYPEQSLHLKTFTIIEPGLDVSLNPEGKLNLLALLPNQQTTEGASTPQGTSTASDTGTNADSDNGGQQSSGGETASWQLSVGAFDIQKAGIDFTDSRIEPAAKVQLRELDVQLSNWNNRPGSVSPFSVNGQLPPGGKFNIEGQLRLLPAFDLSSKIELVDLPLSLAEAYARQAIRVAVSEGSIDADLALSIQADNQIKVSGATEITDLDLRDLDAKQTFAGWNRLAIQQFELDLVGNHLAITELDIREPYGRILIKADGETNMADLITQPASSQKAERQGNEVGDKSADASPLRVTIDSIGLGDGTLDFSDLSLPLPFTSHITQLGGRISNLDTSASPAELILEGRVNEFGHALIKGRVSPADPLRDTDISLDFSNLDMAKVSPYSARFAGRLIESGRLDLDLEYTIDEGQLLGKNAIVLRDFSLGKKMESAGATNLPLDLAVALLKDADGVIRAKLPISGNVNDPQFEVGDLVWKAVVNLITKAASSPFRLLGNMLGLEDKDLGTIEFAAGGAELDPPAQEKINLLSEALQQRPALTLKVNGVFDRKTDIPMLQRFQFDEKFKRHLQETRGTKNASALSAADLRSHLEKLYGVLHPNTDLERLRSTHTSAPPNKPDSEPAFNEKAYNRALRAQLIAAEEIDPQALEELAEARAQAIRAALVADGGLDNNRVVTDSPREITEGNKKRIKLKLDLLP